MLRAEGSCAVELRLRLGCRVRMTERAYNVLFLCTGNSARSILAEAILNSIGAGKFRAYSAGSQPKGEVNTHAVALLRSLGYETAGLRSKSWQEFAKPGSPQIDFIFTVCDNAAGEVCPLWPGKPSTAHWGIADPAEVKGSPAAIVEAFNEAYRLLLRRIQAFAALPLDSLDQAALPTRLKEIGRMEGTTTKAQA